MYDCNILSAAVKASPSKQPCNRLAFNDARLRDAFRWRIAGVLHHLKQLALFQVHSWSLTPLVFEIVLDGVDTMREFLCVEHLA
ncbi:hypothetical protein F1880_009408 [Penicillium rolfsii]|nr:hypothetical protein F1880_009408 [Penicillium rolfsii]